MILQVQDILKDALALIGVMEMDETPSSSEMGKALRAANIMIDRWSSQNLMLRSSDTLSFPLVPGKPIYTIGLSGCDITAPKPIKLTSAYYRDSNNLDTPVEIIEQTVYDNLADRIMSTGTVMYISYDPGKAQQTVQKGTISVYLNPDQAYTLFIELSNYLSEFVNMTDTVTFEPAYYEALIYNLAARLFRYYNDPKLPVPADIVAIAHNSMENIKNMNSVTLIAAMEYPGKVSKYNIYNDGSY